MRTCAVRKAGRRCLLKTMTVGRTAAAGAPVRPFLTPISPWLLNVAGQQSHLFSGRPCSVQTEGRPGGVRHQGASGCPPQAPPPSRYQRRLASLRPVGAGPPRSGGMRELRPWSLACRTIHSERTGFRGTMAIGLTFIMVARPAVMPRRSLWASTSIIRRSG